MLLAALLACAPCIPFAEMGFPAGGEDLARTVADFAAWTGRDGVCVPGVEWREELEEGPHALGRYDGPGEPILLRRGAGSAVDTARTLRHELCHALDAEEGLSSALASTLDHEHIDPVAYPTEALRLADADGIVLGIDDGPLAALGPFDGAPLLVGADGVRLAGQSDPLSGHGAWAAAGTGDQFWVAAPEGLVGLGTGLAADLPDPEFLAHDVDAQPGHVVALLASRELWWNGLTSAGGTGSWGGAPRPVAGPADFAARRDTGTRGGGEVGRSAPPGAVLPTAAPVTVAPRRADPSAASMLPSCPEALAGGETLPRFCADSPAEGQGFRGGRAC